MPIVIDIKLDKGFEQVREAFRNYPRLAIPHLRRASQGAAFAVEREAKIKSPIDTGRLRNSIMTSLGIANQGLTSIVQTNTNYAAAVHEGTKPHWPPIKALEGWAKRRAISPFVVARAISRKGTKAQPFMKEGVDLAKGDIEKIYTKEVTGIFEDIAASAK